MFAVRFPLQRAARTTTLVLAVLIWLAAAAYGRALGIHRIVLTVADLDRSAAFYETALGFQKLGENLITDAEFDAISGTFGARVRVTGLRPQHARGPGLEFLQYLTPSGGRAAPAGARPSDVAHVRLVLEVDDLDHLVAQLTQNSARFISPRPVRASSTPFSKVAMVKDPDGHAVLLVQR